VLQYRLGKKNLSLSMGSNGQYRIPTCDQLENLQGSNIRAVKSRRMTYHAGYAPDVSASSPFSAEDDLRTAILPR
jgi:hypothetical protein